MKKIFKLIEANYINDYKLELKFNDGKQIVVDFELFLKKSSNPQIRKYLDLKLFKSFTLIDGDLDWNDFDLVFPIYDLYTGNILKFDKKSEAS